MINNQTAIIYTSHNQDKHKEIMEFSEAIKDPEKRKEIISILEGAGLLPASPHQHA